MVLVATTSVFPFGPFCLTRGPNSECFALQTLVRHRDKKWLRSLPWTICWLQCMFLTWVMILLMDALSSLLDFVVQSCVDMGDHTGTCHGRGRRDGFAYHGFWQDADQTLIPRDCPCCCFPAPTCPLCLVTWQHCSQLSALRPASLTNASLGPCFCEARITAERCVA